MGNSAAADLQRESAIALRHERCQPRNSGELPESLQNHLANRRIGVVAKHVMRDPVALLSTSGPCCVRISVAHLYYADGIEHELLKLPARAARGRWVAVNGVDQ